MGRNPKEPVYVNINKIDFRDKHVISSKNKMFKEDYLILIVDEEGIKFSIPTIDYNGKLFKTCKSSSKGWNLINISNEHVVEGRFYFDLEDSNEDELIIYFEDGE